MTQPMKIDFVSDVSCPWCIVGLGGLEEALRKVGDLVQAQITFHPFELNPDMPPEGQNIVEHVGQKYGATPEQSASNRAAIHARAAEVGFTMKTNEQSRIYNTFDAHRLLHWAGIEGAQTRVMSGLMRAYWREGKNISNPDVLAEIGAASGMKAEMIRRLLATDADRDEVQRRELHARERGINSAPTFIVADSHAVTGAQPASLWQSVIDELAGQSAGR